MVDKPGYRADWTAKRAWYADHGILPWMTVGGPTVRCSFGPPSSAPAAASTPRRSNDLHARRSG
jgi:hypothetical protein